MEEPVASPGINDLELPPYLPMQRSIVPEFERLSRFPLNPSPQIDESVKHIVRNCESHLEYLLTQKRTDIENYVSQTIDALCTFIGVQHDLMLFTDQFKASRAAVRDRVTQDPELDLENLSELRALTHSNFGDFIVTNHQASKQSASPDPKQHKLVKYLKSLSFIVKNPLEPLPDDGDGEDDEINVSGGKVSLKDPISLDVFLNPVISTACKHTFEKDHILQYMRSGNTQCPITGCNAQVNNSVLEPDNIMKWRVKALLALDLARSDHVDRVE